MSKTHIIKLGGSIAVPDIPDARFIGEFCSFVKERVSTYDEKYFIILGGGKTCRIYQNVLKEIGGDKESLDRIGIATNNYNAELVRLAFGDVAASQIFRFPGEYEKASNSDKQKKIVICGALEPGHSGNYDAVEFAHLAGAKEIINLSNIDYVYSDDPRKNSSAEKFEEIYWEKYFTCIPETWEEPGMSTPFDPIAARLAHKHDIDVVFMKGRPIQNLKDYIETGKVEGTIISNRFAQ